MLHRYLNTLINDYFSQAEATKQVPKLRNVKNENLVLHPLRVLTSLQVKVLEAKPIRVRSGFMKIAFVGCLRSD